MKTNKLFDARINIMWKEQLDPDPPIQFLIFFSVVTSVSVVTDDDPPEMRSRYEEEYQR